MRTAPPRVAAQSQAPPAGRFWRWRETTTSSGNPPRLSRKWISPSSSQARPPPKVPIQRTFCPSASNVSASDVTGFVGSPFAIVQVSKRPAERRASPP